MSQLEFDGRIPDLSQPMKNLWWTCLVKPGATVVDVGANVGDYTLLFSSLVGPDGMVYAIEPAPIPFGVLIGRLSGMSNVRIFPLGVAELCYTVDVIHYRHWTLIPVSPGDERVHNPNYHPGQPAVMKGEFRCEFTTLDTFVQSRVRPRRVDLIKIDTDGMEIRVLRGSLGTLASDRPLLYVELSPYTFSQVGDTIDAAWTLLNDAGYECALDAGSECGGFGPEPILSSLVGPEDGANVLCYPAEKRAAIAALL